MAVRLLVPVYITLIAAIPLMVAVVPLRMASAQVEELFACVCAAWLYCSAYVLVAGGLSRLTLYAIVAGKFRRDVGDAIYGPRRLYALCWTAIYYCQPIYHAVLAIPLLKRFTLRLFGYRGSLDFQAYPDTWLRDLPLLDIGKGAYLSNKATVSPNMCLRNGKIIVMPIRIGAGTMVGHLAMIAPGVEIGSDCEIGIGAALGFGVHVGSNTHVDHEVNIDHESVIGNRITIGTCSYVGRRAVIGDGIRIPPASVVPANTRIDSQAEADALASSPTGRRMTMVPATA